MSLVTNVKDSFAIILFILGVSLNLILLITFIFNKELRIIQNYGLISLTLSDLLMSLIGIFVLRVGDYEPFTSYTLCVGVHQIFILTLFTSSAALLYTSVERFIAVIFPYEYSRFVTNKNSLISIISFWVYGILLVIVPVFHWFDDTELRKNFKKAFCNFYTYQKNSYSYIWLIHLLLVIFLGFLFYIPTIRIVFRQRSNLKMNHFDIKSTYLLILLLLFNQTSFYYQATVYLKMFKLDLFQRMRELHQKEALRLTPLILYSIPSINPLIHGFSKKSVTSKILIFFKRIICKNKVSSTNDPQ